MNEHKKRPPFVIFKALGSDKMIAKTVPTVFAGETTPHQSLIADCAGGIRWNSASLLWESTVRMRSQSSVNAYQSPKPNINSTKIHEALCFQIPILPKARVRCHDTKPCTDV